MIKQEKDQVIKDLRVMAEDLNKYKSAFKKLVFNFDCNCSLCNKQQEKINAHQKPAPIQSQPVILNHAPASDSKIHASNKKTGKNYA